MSNRWEQELMHMAVILSQGALADIWASHQLTVTRAACCPSTCGTLTQFCLARPTLLCEGQVFPAFLARQSLAEATVCQAELCNLFIQYVLGDMQALLSSLLAHSACFQGQTVLSAYLVWLCHHLEDEWSPTLLAKFSDCLLA